MIINKFVFPIKADKTFVSGALPQGYLTANDINKDMFYVLSPSVGATIIKARFQNDKQSEPAEIVDMLATDIDIKMLVDENASYYDLVKDWNVWQGYFPSKALEYVSYNRSGKIGISFMLKQSILPPLPQLEFKGKLVSQDDKVLENGYYIVDTPLYEIDGKSLTFNDVIIKNDNDIIIRKSIVQSGNTGTVEYSVDPSVYGGVDESIDITLTESIIYKLNDNTNEIKYIKLMFTNYYTKDETYNRDEIDNLFEDVNLEIVDLKDDITRIDIKDTEQDLHLKKLDEDIKEINEGLLSVDDETITRNAEKELTLTNFIINLINSKIEQTALNGFVYQPTYDNDLHILTLPMYDMPPLIVDYPIENLVKGIKVEGDNLILTLEDGTERVVPLGSLLVGMASEQWVKDNYYNNTQIDSKLSGYVLKDGSKVLSTNDFTDVLKDKLDGIEAGAEVNVQSDWNVTDTADKAFIKNKPTIPTALVKATKAEAEAGTNDAKYMTPLGTKDAIGVAVIDGGDL